MKIIRKGFKGLICIVIIASFVVGCGLQVNKNAILVIENQSDEQIHNVRLKYTSSKEVVEIGVLKPKEKYEHIINNKQEDSITLYFTDPSGVEHKEIAIGYIIKGMKGKTVLIIYKDNKGDWELK
ncbi:hypothetical protein Q3V94_12965 [Caloramator sp. CAR-1]|uniref:hypothetical protein n=1 Tax=Caloramator sp. CAR-1 TaxID=3062777 RepID=UPI0026E1CCD2|nr:hypothetical protein [Caloramator sp. CAR-1]MDO6355967.1 hypothetical protein [Caloramator sp. CAR-1]